MNDALDLFAESAPEADPVQATPMTEAQRGELRELFGKLQKVTAQDQFVLVEELTGIRLTRVTDLTSSNASLLLHRLRKRVESQSRASTGNAWADREGDTWIDRL